MNNPDRSKKQHLPGNRDSLDRPIPEAAYSTIDTDLARDNLENDLPAADLEDL